MLPSRHRYTELLIRERHDHVHLSGVRETLNAVRETHWVLKGREGVKRVIRKCTICRRYEGKPFTAPPPLPWLAHRSCLWGTVFHVHGDRFCGTTLCQFCVTWETQQSILLPVYINTCCPPWVNWEFDSHLFLTSIPEDLLAEEDFQQSCWRTMRKPLSPHQWMLRRFQGLAKWSSILRTDKLMGSSSWNESLGGVVSGRDSCVV